MKKVRKILFVILILSISQAQAQNLLKVKGVGTVEYGVFGPNKDAKRQAVDLARLDALRSYVSTFDSARRANYQFAESMVSERLGDVIPKYVQISEKKDSGTKRFSVVVEAFIDSGLIEQLIQAAADARKGGIVVANPALGTPAKSEDNYMVFVFVARELGSSKSYDTKRTLVRQDEKEVSGTQTAQEEDTVDGGLELSGSVTARAAVVSSTGGSTERKASQRSYHVFTVSEVNAAVNQVLSTAGYETVDATDVGIDVKAYQSDFGSGDDISPTTRREAVAVCKENGIAYLGTARMDVGLPAIDPASGQKRVNVTVTAQIDDLGGRFPRKVASVAGQPYAALGVDEETAMANALKTAGIETARELLEQLRKKNTP